MVSIRKLIEKSLFSVLVFLERKEKKLLEANVFFVRGTCELIAGGNCTNTIPQTPIYSVTNVNF